MELLQRELQVMDSTATSMCMDNNIDLVVFNMNERGNIVKAVKGEIAGTVISEERWRKKKYETDLRQCRKQDEKAADNLEANLRTIRTGRANANMLERVSVEYYGSPTPINQISSIQVVEGRQLVVKPYDRSILKDVDHAISAANLGLVPQNDGDVIRINVPALTEDRRKELAKEAHKYGEECKVVVRNVRREGNDLVKKDKELTEDMKKDAQEKIQKMTDTYVKKIDAMVKEKSEEIMSV
ncbi:MAG: ribosome recycling factor [Merdibacter sp.]